MASTLLPLALGTYVVEEGYGNPLAVRAQVLGKGPEGRRRQDRLERGVVERRDARHREDPRALDAPVAADEEAHRQLALPPEPRELRDVPVEADASNHFLGIRTPVVPGRVEGDRPGVHEAAVGVRESRALFPCARRGASL